MGRGRISMELIQKEKSRKITFQKRKSGLLKKVNEFAILCDVDVCVILYAPNFEGQGYAEPETWPKDKREVQKILQKYYNTTMDRRPKIYDAQEYFKERMKKVEFDISKVRKEMLKIMYPTWDESFNSLREEQM
ncbi:MADS-box transcription factor PHERES 2-like, partial [Trifolium medium]|nr:MADS-box transcription factor PHERES 2-like [Trifolium medium]